MMNKTTPFRLKPVCLGVASATLMFATSITVVHAADVKPPQPHFNRVHHNKEIVEYMKAYAAAYPHLVSVKSLGKTAAGTDMWMLTINNEKTGKAGDKPASYIDGAIHANEAQAADTVLYTIDYILKNYGKLDKITETVDRSTLYFVPSVSPDSRAKWFDEPSTASYPRSSPWPFDDDRDGRIDEDGPMDINKDGVITTMRKKVPLGLGNRKLDPKDSRVLLPLEPGELGDYLLLGQEGIDQDGDGLIGEDSVGYADPNRTWGYDWAPRYIQNGATDYPLQIPETRSIANWALDHLEVSSVISFHNSGRMILRGPGSPTQTPVSAQDNRTFDYLGREGEKMMPGYRYMITWRDLYTAYGSTTDHFYGIVGAFGFVPELFGRVMDDNNIIRYEPPQKVGDPVRPPSTEPKGFDAMKWNDMLSFGRQFIPFKEFKHPQFGTIEIGGWRQDTGRMPEGWMLEEETHRNAAFVLFNAMNVPKLSFLDANVKKVGNRTWQIEVPIINERAIPSIPSIVIANKLHRLDLATINGGKVLSSGIVRNQFNDQIDLQSHRPERLMVSGVPGFGNTILYFLVETESDHVTVNYDSIKGGKLSKTIHLK
ncbi:M14 family metallopeptidase [Undibacterium cyanobacteriorum]|uniref:M14 family metallopeptidase n=1 Tax=Undibacterium cyanobacteriorum TaxID=3073561 RepID=A0ABY9RFJ7_9BURK|nr:M14 family metallopeptidase [Undibacterium sp. 20NA77.5]WMW79419.1 M14 family metallopeptidase [Undibacterium sp. 20NA77.5]